MTPTAKLLTAGVLIIAAVWAVQRFTPAGPSAGPRPAADLAMESDSAEKSARYERGKELVAPSGFINAEPFTIAELSRDHVVLIDFWTYSCINCQRTQPYLNAWHEKYRDAGLVIVGVHTPEFEFEKDVANVRAAVTKAGIRYPVVLDNDYGTWRAYGNSYWPRKYLIDADGYIVYDHIGEGAYKETEERIQAALEELALRRGTTAPMPSLTDESAEARGRVGTPEIYFGTLRNQGFLDGHPVRMEGSWSYTPEYAECESACAVRLEYDARSVNVVAEAPAGGTLNGIPVRDAALYPLVDEAETAERVLEFKVTPGLRLYTFTFGS